MTKRSFVDTNVIVYAYDSRDTRRQKIAAKLLRELIAAGIAVISTQVVQEFCNIALRPEKPVDPKDLRDIFNRMLIPMLEHQPSPLFYQRAVGLHGQYSLSFYDALIIQAALDLSCDTLYSEDLQAGQQFGQLTIVNPFATEK